MMRRGCPRETAGAAKRQKLADTNTEVVGSENKSSEDVLSGNKSIGAVETGSKCTESVASEELRHGDTLQNKEGSADEGPSRLIPGHEWFKKHGQWSKWLIDQNRVTLVENGRYSNISDHLVQAGILTRSEQEELDETKESRQMSKFLNTLRRKPGCLIEKGFDAIREADPTLYSQVQWPSPRLSGLQNQSSGVGQMSDELISIQTEVREWYKSQLSRFRPIPLGPLLEMDSHYVFTNLMVIQGQRNTRRVTGQHRPAADIKTFEDFVSRMFEGENRTVTFVQGAAGFGKSALCRRLAYLWATNSHHIDQRHFDLVLLVDARLIDSDHNNHCFGIITQLFPVDFDMSEDSICKSIKRCGKSCLLIIDGADEATRGAESALLELLNGKFLRQTNVLITGRPESARKFIKFANCHLEITGFTKDNAEEYVRKYFPDDECKKRDILLEDLKNNAEIASLAVNPWQTSLLCVIAQTDIDNIASNFTDILKELIMTIFNRYISKSDVETNIDETDLFRAATELAKAGMEKNEWKFDKSKVKELCPGELGEHLLKSGLLTQHITVSRLLTTTFWSFSHKSIQEFLCAFHFAKSQENVFRNFLQGTDHFCQLKETFVMTLSLLKHQGLPFRSELSQILEIVCPRYRQLKPGLQKYVGRTSWKKRNPNDAVTEEDDDDDNDDDDDDGPFLIRAFCDILSDLFDMDQSIVDTCISIIRENDDMLRCFVSEFPDRMKSTHLQKMIPIPITNGSDMETLADDSLRLWTFDAMWSIGHRDHEEAVWPCSYSVVFKSSHVYTGDLSRTQRGPPLPWIHCNCLTDAMFTLPYDRPPMTVLSILLLPGMNDVQCVHKFIDYLKTVKTRLTLFLIAPNLKCEDLSRVRLLRLIDKCDNPNVEVRFDWRSFPCEYFSVGKDETGQFQMELEHTIRKPVHHMYFDKYCPA